MSLILSPDFLPSETTPEAWTDRYALKSGLFCGDLARRREPAQWRGVTIAKNGGAALLGGA
ncbi:hypothetical protein CW354_03755 [Marinicaulis flavus]|uniref:Uncharacterized protein n=1 Tax=Hyphococcus luteus TaxID=2058213 RepID=A0A2S7K996_9PROT|nr:hypothetical protein CW354_03755 [Marinicaulis flavus]